MMSEKMKSFLRLVDAQNWRSGSVPRIWSPQYQTALTSNFVSIGFGGALKLTDEGRSILSHDRSPEQ